MAAIAVDSQPDAVDEIEESLNAVADANREKCLEQSKDIFTFGMFRYVTLLDGSPNVDRETVWDTLRERRLMAASPGEGVRGGTTAMRPVLRTKRRLADLIDLACADDNLSLPECYNVERFNDYMSSDSSRHVEYKIMET